MSFNFKPDQISYEIGHPDMLNLLARGIRHLAGKAIPLESTAPESVHIGLTESIEEAGHYMLTLVNTTSGPGRPEQRLIPVQDIQVTLCLPHRSFETYEVLRAQGACEVQQVGQMLEVQIEKLEDFCAIYIQMGG